MSRGRPREFDKTEVLESAMLLFWRNGYKGTSLDDLTQAMNITRPSLYAAFRDKENLFLAAVDHYRNTVIGPVFRRMIEAPSEETAADLLSAFFSSIAVIITNPDTPGCLIACMLEQESCESEVIKKKLAALLSGADEGFKIFLQAHAGELRHGVSTEYGAKILTTTIHGLATRARAGATRTELNEIAKAVIEVICGRP